MAEQIVYRSQLRLHLDNGIHPTTGDTIIKSKTFNNVKTEVTAEQLFEVAQALASLQALPLYGIERVDTSEIVSE